MVTRAETSCRGIDELLGGGVEHGAITMVYGEAGSGKTSLALQSAHACVTTGGGEVIFIDTEGVSSDRVRQICGDGDNGPAGDAHGASDGEGDASEAGSTAMRFLQPRNQDELHTVITAKLPEREGGALVLVDTINGYARLAYPQDKEKCELQFAEMVMALQRLAQERDVPVLLTAQVYERDGDVNPYFGRMLVHVAKTLVLLEKGGAPGLRHARLKKHRSLPEEGVVDFMLTAQGLE